MTTTVLIASATALSIGASPNTVSITAREAWQSLQVSLTPQRPARRRTAAGPQVHLYGPGATLREIEISASGLDVPNLSALALSSPHPVTVTWPGGGSTTVWATWELRLPRASDLHGARTTWSLRGDEVEAPT